MKLLTIQQNISLQPFNTFGIQVKADFFTSMKSADMLLALLQDPQWKAMPKFILGGGSNTLFTQDFAGLVIKNDIQGIQCIDEDDNHLWLKIGAGENWHELVMHCIQHGFHGVENLSLIPGTVGAAPIQNIGAYGVELRDVFHQLEAVDIHRGEIKIFDNAQCEFDYRNSVFKTKYKDQYVITNVTLKLNKKPNFNLSYGAVQETLKEMHIHDLTLKAVSDAVIHIRQSKLPDPKVIGNAGSFFKNPVISANQFKQLQEKFPHIPHYPADSSDSIKIAAGWLIEQCGWKGKRIGHIGVHDKQALVIVNYGSGTGNAIRDLALQIQNSVLEKFQIQLVPEVNII